MDGDVTARAVIFDIDGTLSDSFQAAFRVTAEVLGREVSEAEYHDGTKYSTPERLARHAGLDPAVDGDAFYAEGARLAAAFDALFIERVSAETAPLFDGVRAVVAGIAAREGVAVGALTNACVAYAEKVLTANGIRENFGCVHGADDVPAAKPKPDGLLQCARELGGGLPAAACVYVGDSPSDGAAARAAGMRSVGVTWGSHPRATLEPAFDQVVDTPGALAAALSALLGDAAPPQAPAAVPFPPWVASLPDAAERAALREVTPAGAAPLSALRYLRGWGRDVPKARAMFEACVAWRAANRVDALLGEYTRALEGGGDAPATARTPAAPTATATAPEAEATTTTKKAPKAKVDHMTLAAVDGAKARFCKRRWYSGFHGVDNDGLPVLVVRMGTADPAGIAREVGLDAFILHSVMEMEQLQREAAAVAAAAAAAGAPGTAQVPAYSFTQIFDMGGFAWGRAFSAISVFRALTPILDKMYPERVKRTVIIRCPLAMRAIWRLAKPMVPKETLKKISLHGFKQEEWVAALCPAFMARDQLPRYLGGACSCADAEAECGSSCPEGGAVPVGAFEAEGDGRI